MEGTREEPIDWQTRYRDGMAEAATVIVRERDRADAAEQELAELKALVVAAGLAPDTDEAPAEYATGDGNDDGEPEPSVGQASSLSVVRRTAEFDVGDMLPGGFTPAPVVEGRELEALVINGLALLAVNQRALLERQTDPDADIVTYGAHCIVANLTAMRDAAHQMAAMDAAGGYELDEGGGGGGGGADA